MDEVLEYFDLAELENYLFLPPKVDTNNYLHNELTDEKMESLDKDKICSLIRRVRDPKSLWERVFAEIGDVGEWKASMHDIHDVRNSVAHQKKITTQQYNETISRLTKDYIINYQDMQGLGMTGNLALPTLIAISSAALSKPPISSLAVLGEISIGGTLIKVEDLASTLQVCLDSGAKKVLLPITSAADLGTVPSDLVGAFSLIFYSSPEEAVYKALGVE